MSTSALPSSQPPQRLAANPPFRHEHVGSFLRPKALLEARAALAAGKISAADLRKVEDEHIKVHVERLLAEGVPDITDGEFRRQYFHIDFLKMLQGCDVKEGVLESSGKHVPPTMTVTGKIKHSKNIEVDNFNYLKTLVPAEQHANIKITIPSPTMLHFRGGRKGISQEAYPDLDDFFADLAAAYREEVQALYDAGCRYLQMDDTNLAYLTDPKMRQDAAARGEDVDALPSRYAKLINASFANRPEDMVIGIHLCKGNFKSQFFAAGSEEGYAPIAKALFGELNVDVYFLEWEDERSGKDFSALAGHLSENKTVVLGLVSTKLATMEDKAALVAKIHDAAKYAPGGLKQLAISGQCGFSSTHHGNAITEEDQYKKLRLLKEVAEEVWGSK
ncbi:UROD/MetE-like protein [Microstroma glucosiphilum]|uniref:UROD/MetE-like protein n=1 Tax=Pseudomicrostroma glucosiphilum TaxID=1684307 RepID=A0A316UEF7_9BASI|nr:UROD/MetE-like protein [Pseudomicrostroma glucosiphilum]PWN23274.1 UROD/MetE-like protein [Pseudomicrostroma glucosiphilum]